MPELRPLRPIQVLLGVGIIGIGIVIHAIEVEVIDTNYDFRL